MISIRERKTVLLVGWNEGMEGRSDVIDLDFFGLLSAFWSSTKKYGVKPYFYLMDVNLSCQRL